MIYRDFSNFGPVGAEVNLEKKGYPYLLDERVRIMRVCESLGSEGENEVIEEYW